MVFFFLVETIPLFVSNLFNIFEIINKHNKQLVTDTLLHKMQLAIALIWIVYPLLQAFGMIILKDPKDPF